MCERVKAWLQIFFSFRALLAWNIWTFWLWERRNPLNTSRKRPGYTIGSQPTTAQSYAKNLCTQFQSWFPVLGKAQEGHNWFVSPLLSSFCPTFLNATWIKFLMTVLSTFCHLKDKGTKSKDSKKAPSSFAILWFCHLFCGALLSKCQNLPVARVQPCRYKKRGKDSLRCVMWCSQWLFESVQNGLKGAEKLVLSWAGADFIAFTISSFY